MIRISAFDKESHNMDALTRMATYHQGQDYPMEATLSPGEVEMSAPHSLSSIHNYLRLLITKQLQLQPRIGRHQVVHR